VEEEAQRLVGRLSTMIIYLFHFSLSLSLASALAG